MKRKECSDMERSLIERIETEHTIFKLGCLSFKPEEIYDNCEKIRFYECVYEYFRYSENISQNHVQICARCGNILKILYDLYLKYEYLKCGTWEEIEEILDVLENEQREFADEIIMNAEEKKDFFS